VPAEIDHEDLYNNGYECDTKEQRISADTLHDVEFFILQESCVQLVEDLHEDEYLEQEGQVDQFHCDAIFLLFPWQEDAISISVFVGCLTFICRLCYKALPVFSSATFSFRMFFLQEEAIESTKSRLIKICDLPIFLDVPPFLCLLTKVVAHSEEWIEGSLEAIIVVCWISLEASNIIFFN